MVELNPAVLPPDYVSIAVLRERWLKKQNDKREREEEEAAKRGGEESGGEGDDSGGEWEGVVEEVMRGMGDGEGVVGSERNVGFRGMGRRRFGDFNVVDGRRAYGDRRINEGEDGRRRFGKRGDVVLEGSKGYGKRRVDVGGKFGGFEVDGGRMGGVKYGGDRRRFGRGENQGEMKNVVEGVGGKFGGLEVRGERKGSDKYGGDCRRFGKVSGVWKGRNEDEKRDVVDVKIFEGSKVLGERQVNEEVEIGRKFSGLLRNGGRMGKFGRDCRGFGKVSGVGKGENVVEKRYVVHVREESEAVKGDVVDVRDENVVDAKMSEVIEAVDIGKKFGDLMINGGGRKCKFRFGGDRRRFQHQKEKIYVPVRKENEVEKPIPVAVRVENEVEKRYLVDVKEENDAEKHIPVAVRDENEVEKQNLVDVKMSETSKGFGHRRENEAIGGKFVGFSGNGWRKGDRYGRDRRRFGSWKNKQNQSGMMWVKKCDAGADKQAQVETAEVK